jgi:hypothetical protein
LSVGRHSARPLILSQHRIGELTNSAPCNYLLFALRLALRSLRLLFAPRSLSPRPRGVCENRSPRHPHPQNRLPSAAHYPLANFICNSSVKTVVILSSFPAQADAVERNGVKMNENKQVSLPLDGERPKRFRLSYGGDVLGSYATAKEALESLTNDQAARPITDPKRKYKVREGGKEISVAELKRRAEQEKWNAASH